MSNNRRNGNLGLVDLIAGIASVVVIIISLVNLVLNVFGSDSLGRTFTEITLFCSVLVVGVVAFKFVSTVNLPGPTIVWQVIVVVVAIIAAFSGFF